MHENFQKRALEFQRRIADENIDVVLIYDPDNIYFLSAYWGYLGMDFGRPTVMIVPQSGPCTVITPGLEAEMARAMTWIEDVREWTDGIGGEWMAHLKDLLKPEQGLNLGIETFKTHPVILEYLRRELPGINPVDISHILALILCISQSRQNKNSTPQQ